MIKMLYKDTLLLEFLMFSDNIEDEILDFSYSLSEISVNNIQTIIYSLKNKNLYTEKNLSNLKEIVKFLSPKITNYERLLNIIDEIEPSNDIYYYEYLEKYDVLKRCVGNNSTSISVNYMKDSIRFDYYAMEALLSNSDDYVEKYLRGLVNNSLFLLFVNKLLNEQPVFFENEIILKRICGILEYNITSLEDDEVIEYHKQLLKKVKYFSKNSNAEIFDYELFMNYKNHTLFEYLITSNVDLKKYHNYIMSEQFLNFIEECICYYEHPNRQELFIYNSEMSERFKAIISYILNNTEKADNLLKLRCNILLAKWNSFEVKNEFLFYEHEFISKSSSKELISRCTKSALMEFLHYYEDPIVFINDIKLSLMYDYYILDTLTLDEESFKESMLTINLEYFIRWMRKTMKIDINFFTNELLRERTLQILEAIPQYSTTEFIKESKKLKKKIIKLNKGLE